MALRTARIHRVRGRPPLLAAGITSLIHSHSSSVRSLGYIFSFIYPFYTTHEDFSDRLLEPGDTLVVWRLDRLGRSMTHLVTLIQELLQRHVSFRSLSDGAIDTTTASGELVFHIFSALAQFERRLIQERTHAGLAVARARGRRGGRRALQPGDPQVQLAYTMHVDHHWTIDELCATL